MNITTKISLIAIFFILISAAGCVNMDADSIDRAPFFIPDKTTLFMPSYFSSEEFVEKYGAPMYIPDSPETYALAIFHNPISERNEVINFEFSVYGKMHNLTMTKISPFTANDRVVSYAGQLDENDRNSAFFLTVSDENLLMGTLPYDGHTIYIEPMNFEMAPKQPLHIIYVDTYPKMAPPKIPEPISSDIPLFTYVGHTKIIPNDELEIYGPVHISPRISKFQVVQFDQLLPDGLGSPSITVPITIRGTEHSIKLDRVDHNYTELYPLIHEYRGKLSGAGSKIFFTQYEGGGAEYFGALSGDSRTAFGVNFQNDKLFSGSIRTPDDFIVIIPLQIGEYYTKTKNPPYLMYAGSDVLPGDAVLPKGELRFSAFHPTDYIGETVISLEDYFDEYPVVKKMVYGIHPPMKAGILPNAGDGYKIYITENEADELMEVLGGGEWLSWYTGMYVLERG